MVHYSVEEITGKGFGLGKGRQKQSFETGAIPFGIIFFPFRYHSFDTENSNPVLVVFVAHRK